MCDSCERLQGHVTPEIFSKSVSCFWQPFQSIWVKMEEKLQNTCCAKNKMAAVTLLSGLESLTATSALE